MGPNRRLARPWGPYESTARNVDWKGWVGEEERVRTQGVEGEKERGGEGKREKKKNEKEKLKGQKEWVEKGREKRRKKGRRETEGVEA